MNEKLLTVPEYAQLRNISESAVYQKIKRGKLKTTEKQLETGRYIKLIVVDEKTSQEIEANSQGNEDNLQESEAKSTETSQLIEVLSQTIEVLREQLKEKDSQINRLQEMLATNQQLQAQSNTLLLQATTEPQPEPEAAAIVPAEPPKKSFFARLFNK